MDSATAGIPPRVGMGGPVPSRPVGPPPSPGGLGASCLSQKYAVDWREALRYLDRPPGPRAGSPPPNASSNITTQPTTTPRNATLRDPRGVPGRRGLVSSHNQTSLTPRGPGGGSRRSRCPPSGGPPSSSPSTRRPPVGSPPPPPLPKGSQPPARKTPHPRDASCGERSPRDH